MEYLKNNFDYYYYLKNNNFVNNEFPNKDSALNHWIYIGIFNNLKCNNDNLFLKEEKSIIKFISNLDNTIYEKSLNEKKNILLNIVNKKNLFTFNFNFFKIANNLNQENLYEYYINEGHGKGLIFSEKQLKIYYPDIEFEYSNNNINVVFKNSNYKLDIFCKKFIYNLDIQFFLKNFKIIFDNLKTVNLCCILHIGDIIIGLKLLNKLKNILIDNYALVVTINNNLLEDGKIDLLYRDIKYFKNYLIVTISNYGNDISPFLIIYNYLIINNFKFKYLFKLHTKSLDGWRYKLLKCFENKNINNLTKYLNSEIGMIGSIEYLYNYDKCNNKILEKLYDDNIKNYQFIAGTIFLTYFDMFIDILNYPITKSLLLFPYYNTNLLFYETSLPHSFERMLGFEIYKKNKYIYGLEYYNQNLFIIFHVADKNIFDLILNENKEISKIKNILITIIDPELESYILNKLVNSKILIVENKGMDIGGFLQAIKYIFNNNLYNNKYIYIKLHTKTNKEWRNQMIKPIFKNLDLIIKFPRNKPYLFGSSNNIIRNKVVNRNYIKDIIERNNLDIFKFEKFIDEYNFLDIWFNNKTDSNLFLNDKFYSYYEYILNPNYHWNNNGINEFHRVNNPCHIKSFGLITFMVAGTVFCFNNKYLE